MRRAVTGRHYSKSAHSAGAHSDDNPTAQGARTGKRNLYG
jgi:hypothetical protein